MTAAVDVRARLVDRLEASGVLTPGWRQAFLDVGRHEFLPDVFWASTGDGYERCDRARSPERWLELAYSDVAIVTQWDDGTSSGQQREPTSSVSMPTMVASMLRDLDVHEGHKVWEGGTGPGWNAGLLARRQGAHNVVTVELDAVVAAQAAANFRALDIAPTAVVGDAAHGYLPGAPYDRGILTCSVRHVPPALIGQIRRHGVLVLPFAPLFGGGAVARLTVTGTTVTGTTATGPFTGSSAFMRMRQQRYQAPPVDDYLPGDWPGDAVREYTTLNPLNVVDDWLASFVVGLAVPDLYYRRSNNGGSGMTTLWLFDTGVTSWATVDFVDGASRFEVRQSGSRRMWSEVEDTVRWWTAAGRPGFERFGLTLEGGEHRAWLHQPANPLPSPRGQD
ncbi:protein-L-isoaspartate(D-aspartate) O-methyltransferase [Kitasatospora sp. NPDC056446]|uniref:protein-L-isoaspartate(D-aspartate) O-methyltransferase n=1 Tax=Kitasatospora sp. NPDC056446 TaxID=3345819 RepID=UPI0036864856